ncbi:ATP-dependent DNA helicase II subunit 2 [Blastomyces dermatitidis ATCC 18188]|uniref:ATP-dependent DNA helicase II subunit 2 n=1 Tax=Ajellomyces dermatitidis (strain ATCC 18188 / CBS 674.68) TaxID=653446 RepID=F2TP32_AJEDA|nr:ATP-dependent DNA helicase II subunit 2 [Blastomyces dermatitidis ATCC 18188]
MADKEATVYIVDVGKNMGECHNGRSISNLDWAMRYIWDKITTTVATGRKTATLGVIGLKTDDTNNPLWEKDEEESYANLSVFQGISQILMSQIRDLRGLIKPSHTTEGDAISSLILAIDMIVRYCKKLKYKRKIVLVTDGTGAMDIDGIEEIVSKINEENIELVILGVDFDDPEYGFKEEDKDPLKAKNENHLKQLVEDCEGIYGTLEHAISEMEIPRTKVVRSMPTFKGDLRLGDPEQYSSALSIQVERYYRTYAARPPAASSFVSSAVLSEGQETTQSSATLAAKESSQEGGAVASALTSVRNARTYQVNDEEAAGGKRDVERDELAKGYEYGRTAVHITESDENITKLETDAALEFIGFIPSDKYDRYMNMSTSNIIIAQKTNNKAILALSSIIHALFELECCAVGRLVPKAGKAPLVVLLAPSIEADYECLLEVQLPFAEDVRSYRFPPLDKVITVSGKTVTEHRNLPNNNLLSRMADYVDSLELTEKDEDGETVESMSIEDSFSPLLHRIDQAIRWRAVHPSEPLPPVPEILQKLSHQPEDLQAQSKDTLAKLIAASDVKKVPPKAKGRKRDRDTDKPLSGLNVEELLQTEKRVKISANNAIPEFKQLLVSSQDLGAVKDAVKQMSAIIESQIRHSLGDANYDRAVEGLGTMKEELVAFEEPALYNDFIRGLKVKLLGNDLGGDRREMWWYIRKNRLGLIDKKLSELSDVTEEEARAFLSAK